MKKQVFDSHTQTVIYIVPVGVDNIPAEKVVCNCQDTKGENHVNCRYKKMSELQPQ